MFRTAAGTSVSVDVSVAVLYPTELANSLETKDLAISHSRGAPCLTVHVNECS
jgi:hypothetical protein